MNQELEPPGEFSATLAACGSSSTFFVDITDMARLDSNLMTEIVNGGELCFNDLVERTKWIALEGRVASSRKARYFLLVFRNELVW